MLPPDITHNDGTAMLLVQISDTHIEEAGAKAYGQFDTTRALERCLAAILKLDRRPDFIVHTGDLAHHGSLERYRLFRSIMDDFPIPYCAIPGNHDARDLFREAFSDRPWMPVEFPFIQFVVEGTIRLICLDSTIPHETPGELCATRLDWLEKRLAEAPGHPTIVALHHPPFATGMTGGSSDGLVRGGVEFAHLLRRFPNVVRVISGHNHRAVTAAFGGTTGYVVPAVSYPFALEMGAERRLSLAGEPPGFGVHLRLDDDGTGAPGLITHTVPIGDWPPPMPLLRGGRRVLPDTT
ncbi:MAG: phosphodiesterase [Hyphomicrobiaceae bacterium]